MPKEGFLCFELEDLGCDCGRQFRLTQGWRGVRFESLFSELLIEVDPAREGLLTDAGLLRDEPAGKALLQIELHGLEFEGEEIAAVVGIFSARNPLGGLGFFFSTDWLTSSFM